MMRLADGCPVAPDGLCEFDGDERATDKNCLHCGGQERSFEQEGDPIEPEDDDFPPRGGPQCGDLMRHLREDEQAESWAVRWALRIFFGLVLLLLLGALFAPLVLGILGDP
jgi:hypothetical protein